MAFSLGGSSSTQPSPSGRNSPPEVVFLHQNCLTLDWDGSAVPISECWVLRSPASLDPSSFCLQSTEGDGMERKDPGLPTLDLFDLKCALSEARSLRALQLAPSFLRIPTPGDASPVLGGHWSSLWRGPCGVERRLPANSQKHPSQPSW